MPQRLYSLDKEQKQILGVSWKGKYKNLELKLNDKPLGKIENRQELLQGKVFEISHDKKLTVRLIREMHLFTELELLVNGFPVEKSMTHPVKMLNDVFLLIIFIAAVNLIAGVLGLVTDAVVFDELGIGFWNVLYAGIFVILGFMIREMKSSARSLNSPGTACAPRKAATLSTGVRPAAIWMASSIVSSFSVSSP